VVSRLLIRGLAAVVVLLWGDIAAAQPAGSIRGVVYDKDFDAPLPLVQVLIVETDRKTQTAEEGNYVLTDVAPGSYTLVFSREGYARQVRANVVVIAGRLTEVDAALSGEFTEMEEFIVQELQLGGATEAGLLNLRFDSPALMDSISADFLSRAGASDAAGALNLVTGATVSEGKFAVIRGLPDRYVASMLNSVRLPSADENTRAVELDQFPAAVIENVQVSKTFTPDQQGDASGGAVNIVLRSIPEQAIFQISSQISFNSQVSGQSDFVTYEGGGVNFWGNDADDRGIQFDNLGGNWTGAVGVSFDDAPVDYKWSMSLGGSHQFDNGVRVGGFASFFYERDSSFFDNGVNDQLWVVNPGENLTPQTLQGTPEDGDFKTALFDVTEGSEIVQWGGLGTAGVEFENHRIGAAYYYARTTEDTATLAEDTRGKEFFFPDYDPDDPTGDGNTPGTRNSAPYIRTETLLYRERTTETLQFNGRHVFPGLEFLWLPLHDGIDGVFRPLPPELDWTVSTSSADADEPDKRQFGSLWLAESFNPGFPPFVPPFFDPAVHLPFKPAANFTLGNLQRIFKTIEEESDQFTVNLTLPFEQWTGDEGSLKFGVFGDDVTRDFDQETFSNFNDNTANFQAEWEVFWSQFFPDEDHPVGAGPPFVDVDYHGEQEIAAWYAMLDLPLTSELTLIGGVRVEDTEISIVNVPEPNALWFPPGASAPVTLMPGDADVELDENDVLPSIGLIYTPWEPLTLRASYSHTIARPVFKELTPILQQEFLGGDVFVGNPELQLSALDNYDIRVDYTPYEGGLVSFSYFKKDIDDPIEIIQRVTGFTFNTPVNFPRGELSGFEVEVRQDLVVFWDALDGLSIGGNATFIDSEVTIPDDLAMRFAALQAPMTTRDMVDAPEHLYNLYLTWDIAATGTQFSIFYTVKGDTLVAGAGESAGNFIPDVYAREYDTLNLIITQKLGQYFKLKFQAKNLTNPTIEEVYRSAFIDGDVRKTSYTRGIEYVIGLSAEFTF